MSQVTWIIQYKPQQLIAACRGNTHAAHVLDRLLYEATWEAQRQEVKEGSITLTRTLDAILKKLQETKNYSIKPISSKKTLIHYLNLLEQWGLLTSPKFGKSYTLHLDTLQETLNHPPSPEATKRGRPKRCRNFSTENTTMLEKNATILPCCTNVVGISAQENTTTLTEIPTTFDREKAYQERIETLEKQVQLLQQQLQEVREQKIVEISEKIVGINQNVVDLTKKIVEISEKMILFSESTPHESPLQAASENGNTPLDNILDSNKDSNYRHILDTRTQKEERTSSQKSHFPEKKRTEKPISTEKGNREKKGKNTSAHKPHQYTLEESQALEAYNKTLFSPLTENQMQANVKAFQEMVRIITNSNGKMTYDDITLVANFMKQEKKFDGKTPVWNGITPSLVASQLQAKCEAARKYAKKQQAPGNKIGDDGIPRNEQGQTYLEQCEESTQYTLVSAYIEKAQKDGITYWDLFERHSFLKQPKVPQEYLVRKLQEAGMPTSPPVAV